MYLGNRQWQKIHPSYGAHIQAWEEYVVRQGVEVDSSENHIVMVIARVCYIPLSCYRGSACPEVGLCGPLGCMFLEMRQCSGLCSPDISSIVPTREKAVFFLAFGCYKIQVFT